MFDCLLLDCLSLSVALVVEGLFPASCLVACYIVYGATPSQYQSMQVTCAPAPSERDLMDCHLDAVMLSPHKLVGGPGSCGVLVVRRDIIRSEEPQSPGAPSSQCVAASTWDSFYSKNLMPINLGLAMF